MELTEKQKEIAESSYEKVVVISAPAVGKSRTAAARIEYLLSQGVPAEDICVISFTVAAAEVLAARVKNSGVFIGTFHSLLFSMLARGGISIGTYLERQEFDKCFELIKKYPEVCKTGKIFIIDEAQDMIPDYYELLFTYLKPRGFMLFGDFRQTLYGFNGASPDTLLHISEMPDVKTYELTENFRNAGAVIECSREILEHTRFSEHSSQMRDSYGYVEEDYFSLPRLEEIVKNADEELKEIFILCRTNAMVNLCSAFLKRLGIPHTNFSELGQSDEAFAKGMEENTIKVLTTFKAKGLEANMVIVAEPTFFNEEERLITYVAFTRARDKLFILNKEPKKYGQKKNKKVNSWM